MTQGRTIKITEDGSSTIFVPDLNEHFHSVHGAITESMHVFIHAGFQFLTPKNLSILEVGFGTGLNAYLTYLENQKLHKNIFYYAIEKFPLKHMEYTSLNYTELHRNERVFHALHEAPWDEETAIGEGFHVVKIRTDFCTFDLAALGHFDLIYYDAFAPEKQPELWDQRLFQLIYERCNPGAVFVTYCAKGEVRRSLQSAGFHVERLPGPPGKREMLRALK